MLVAQDHATSGAGAFESRRMFYCIGAQKGGTTWLWTYLRAHPEVHLTSRKEVHYWDTIRPPYLPYYPDVAARQVEALEQAKFPQRLLNYLPTRRARRLADARAYRDMFRAGGRDGHRAYRSYLMREWKGQPVVGDISPGYAMMERSGFAELDAASPDARYVFLLRDPVARLWSNLRHNRSRGFLAAESDAEMQTAFRRALDDTREGPFQRSDYARTIRELESVVPARRILYLLHETMFDPAEMRRLTDFLGIAPMAADTGSVVNPGSREEAPLAAALVETARARFAHVYELAEAKFGGALPTEWRDAEHGRTSAAGAKGMSR